MALSVSSIQNYQGLEAMSLKSAVRDVLANAQGRSAEGNVVIDLYNGQIDAMVARQVAISGTGLQVTLNNNLETAIKFLRTKAAETNAKTSAEVISIDSAKKDKKGSNPFYNSELFGNKKQVAKKPEYLFITAA